MNKLLRAASLCAVAALAGAGVREHLVVIAVARVLHVVDGGRVARHHGGCVAVAEAIAIPITLVLLVFIFGIAVLLPSL